jgi:hypothetical protein
VTVNLVADITDRATHHLGNVVSGQDRRAEPTQLDSGIRGIRLSSIPLNVTPDRSDPDA